MASEEIFSETFISENSENNESSNFQKSALLADDLKEQNASTASTSSDINRDGNDSGNEGVEAATAIINRDEQPKQQQHPKLVQLPLSKIKSMMKLDPDFQLASHEAVFLIAKSTELFIESLAKESFIFTSQAKKKTIQKRDVDLAIASVDSLIFLDGAMNI